MATGRFQTQALLLAALLTASACATAGDGNAVAEPAPTAIGSAGASADSEQLAITVYKLAGCVCCERWVEHLRQHGFEVTAVEKPRDELEVIKRRLGVSKELESCHTAMIDGYVIEGHVHADAIRRLVDEAPQTTGLAVPGMIAGTPGMPSEIDPDYDIIAFERDGGTKVYESR